MIGSIVAFTVVSSSLLAATAAAPTQADVDALIAQLASSNGDAVGDAACGLGRLGRAASRAIPALAGVLQGEILANENPPRAAPARQSRDEAPSHCDAIKDEMGQRAFDRAWVRFRHARPGSVGDGRHDESAIAWRYGPVVWAIRQLDGGEVAARVLLDQFRRDPELRCDYQRVPRILASLGPKALPALEEGLRDTVTQVRYFAVRAIPDLEPLPVEAEKLLQHTIDWDVGDVRSAAVQGLEAVRVTRGFEREAEEREQREAAAGRKDWLAEFPSYSGASKVCSGHVLGSADGKRREIAFSLYATKDDPAAVVGFYASARSLKAERGATTLTARSADGKKTLSVNPVSGSYPDCGVKAPKDARTVVVVSQMTP